MPGAITDPERQRQIDASRLAIAARNRAVPSVSGPGGRRFEVSDLTKWDTPPDVRAKLMGAGGGPTVLPPLAPTELAEQVLGRPALARGGAAHSGSRRARWDRARAARREAEAAPKADETRPERARGGGLAGFGAGLPGSAPTPGLAGGVPAVLPANLGAHMVKRALRMRPLGSRPHFDDGGDAGNGGDDSGWGGGWGGGFGGGFSSGVTGGADSSAWGGGTAGGYSIGGFGGAVSSVSGGSGVSSRGSSSYSGSQASDHAAGTGGYSGTGGASDDGWGGGSYGGGYSGSGLSGGYGDAGNDGWSNSSSPIGMGMGADYSTTMGSAMAGLSSLGGLNAGFSASGGLAGSPMGYSLGGFDVGNIGAAGIASGLGFGGGFTGGTGLAGFANFGSNALGDSGSASGLNQGYGQAGFGADNRDPAFGVMAVNGFDNSMADAAYGDRLGSFRNAATPFGGLDRSGFGGLGGVNGFDSFDGGTAAPVAASASTPDVVSNPAATGWGSFGINGLRSFAGQGEAPAATTAADFGGLDTGAFGQPSMSLAEAALASGLPGKLQGFGLFGADGSMAGANPEGYGAGPVAGGLAGIGSFTGAGLSGSDWSGSVAPYGGTGDVASAVAGDATGDPATVAGMSSLTIPVGSVLSTQFQPGFDNFGQSTEAMTKSLGLGSVDPGLNRMGDAIGGYTPQGWSQAGEVRDMIQHPADYFSGAYGPDQISYPGVTPYTGWNELSPNFANGLLGNAHYESGGNLGQTGIDVTAVNMTGGDTGMFQDTGGRKTAMLDALGVDAHQPVASLRSDLAGTFSGQLGNAMGEITGDPTYRSVLAGALNPNLSSEQQAYNVARTFEAPPSITNDPTSVVARNNLMARETSAAAFGGLGGLTGTYDPGTIGGGLAGSYGSAASGLGQADNTASFSNNFDQAPSPGLGQALAANYANRDTGFDSISDPQTARDIAAQVFGNLPSMVGYDTTDRGTFRSYQDDTGNLYGSPDAPAYSVVHQGIDFNDGSQPTDGVTTAAPLTITKAPEAATPTPTVTTTPDYLPGEKTALKLGVNAAVGAIPVVGVANAISGLVGGPTVGGLVTKYSRPGTVSPVGGAAGNSAGAAANTSSAKGITDTSASSSSSSTTSTPGNAVSMAQAAYEMALAHQTKGPAAKVSTATPLVAPRYELAATYNPMTDPAVLAALASAGVAV